MISASKEDSPFIPDSRIHFSVHVQRNEVHTEGVYETLLFGNNPFQATYPFTAISHKPDALNAMGALIGWEEEVPWLTNISPRQSTVHAHLTDCVIFAMSGKTDKGLVSTYQI